jgi:hypothetical protein
VPDLAPLALRLRRLADELRAEADAIARAARAVPWEGEGGDAMRWAVRRSVRSLRRAALAHDEAARALDRHAEALERLDARPLLGLLGAVA